MEMNMRHEHGNEWKMRRKMRRIMMRKKRRK